MNARMVTVNLSKLLEERGLSMYKLAKDTNLAYTTLWNLEKGRSQGVSFDVMEKVCLTLECTPSDLFTISPEKAAKKKKESR